MAGTDSKNYMGKWTFNGQNTRESGEPGRHAAMRLPTGCWAARRPAIAAYPSDTFGGDYTAWHFYVQDDIKVSTRLTLNIGLRYEYTPWTTAYRGQTGTFDGTQARPIIVASKTNEIDLGAQPAAPTAYGYLKDLIQTSQRSGLALLDHLSRQESVGAAIRVGVAANRRTHSHSRRLRHLL